jgi:hypothetical protein
MLSFDRLKADTAELKGQGQDTSLLDAAIASHQAEVDKAKAEFLEKMSRNNEAYRQRRNA